MNRIFKLRAIVFIVFVVIILLGLGIFANNSVETIEDNAPTQETSTVRTEIVGTSVQGRNIEAHYYGTGDKLIAFIGGIHGGYEWNSVVLAYEMMDHIIENPEIIPENLTVAIIPSANPDGVYKIVGKEGRFSSVEVPAGIDQSVGRFNANDVDLNRNFDCKWQPQSTWRGKTVGAGAAAFSEPEARAIRDFVLKNNPSAVIFWHSAANNVYASECENGVLPVTLDIMNTYATAGNYGAVASFDAYPVTGDAEGWLASIGIPAITVELQTHESIDWQRNLSGFQAVLNYFK
jgi:hypothetical protein